MSDSEIELIPEDPRHVPSAERQQASVQYFRGLAPEADEIEVTTDTHVEFRDCGENFESIACPSCHAPIDDDVWGELMNADYDGEGFRLHAYPMPCCGASHDLNALDCRFPQGLSRFALTARNPSLGQLSPAVHHELEEILGCKLRVIYRHI